VKKIWTSIIVILILILMLPATIYVQAHKSNFPVSDYLGFVNQLLMEKQEEAEQTWAVKMQESADTTKEQLMEFYLDKLSGAKKNVEQHRQDYLLQLEDTVKVLKQRDFKEYEEKKTEEVRNEIEIDAESYLEKIISEK